MAFTRRNTEDDATWARAWTADALSDLVALSAVGGTAGPHHGDIAFVTATGQYYLWMDDDSWTQITGVSGTPGPAGSQGQPGLDGIDGIDGFDGINGVNGAQGIPGTNGVNGLQGIPGTDGLDGEDGEQGFPGSPGNTGVAGTAGIQGDPGPPGLDAEEPEYPYIIPGERGATGSSGGGGSVTIAVATAAFPAKRNQTVVITDGTVSSTSNILAWITGIADGLANAGDLVDVYAMRARARTGAFDLDMDFLTPWAGSISISYMVMA